MHALLWKRNSISSGIKMQSKPFPVRYLILLKPTVAVFTDFYLCAETYCDFQFPQPLSLSLDVCSDCIHWYISKSGVCLEEKWASSLMGPINHPSPLSEYECRWHSDRSTIRWKGNIDHVELSCHSVGRTSGKCDKAGQNQDSCPSSKLDSDRDPMKVPVVFFWNGLLWFVSSLDERQSKLKKALLYLRVPNVGC